MQTCHLCWSSDSVHFGETARVQCQQPKGSSGLQRAGLVEKEMATHSSILAWKSPWTEEPGGLQSMGLHDWACVHEGGGWWVGSNKLEELKKKKRKKEQAWDLGLTSPAPTPPQVLWGPFCDTGFSALFSLNCPCLSLFLDPPIFLSWGHLQEHSLEGWSPQPIREPVLSLSQEAKIVVFKHNLLFPLSYSLKDFFKKSFCIFS